MEIARVALGTRSYDITILVGGLVNIKDWLQKIPVKTGALVVADTNSANFFGSVLLESMNAVGFSATMTVVPAGEASKSLAMADCLYEAAIRAGLDRSGTIVALGGGVVGDLAGFVASTYLRGVSFLQIPTTLLSQVDSSVGGKVAVNHTLGKNLIGSFYQPQAVLIDPQTLATLPDREFASGMAEVLKYGLIADANFFRELTADAQDIGRREPQRLARMIAHCCRLKAEFVERDEQDTGERMLLNFGHTVGHAIEKAGDFERFTHGEGVALGMLAATRLSELHYNLPEKTTASVKAAIKAYRLPTQATGLDSETLLQFMGTDKKRVRGSLRWILLRAIGQAESVCDISINSVTEALQGILAVE
jgi:3-dehydroquinate synthase